jgi:uncharacterized membrane protein
VPACRLLPVSDMQDEIARHGKRRDGVPGHDPVISGLAGNDELVGGGWACPWSPGSSAVHKLAGIERRRVAARALSDRVGDHLVKFAGSGVFAILHAVWFSAWIIINGRWLPGVRAFDPYPFSFLTMVVSLEAIFITLAVLNRQNRMGRESDRRAQLELVVNVLAERESTVTIQMLQRLATRLNVPVDDLLQPELSGETDLEHLLAELDEKVAAED